MSHRAAVDDGRVGHLRPPASVPRDTRPYLRWRVLHFGELSCNLWDPRPTRTRRCGDEFVIPPAAHVAHTKGTMSLTGIVVAGTVGSWLGASVMYWASRLLGRPLPDITAIPFHAL